MITFKLSYRVWLSLCLGLVSCFAASATEDSSGKSSEARAAAYLTVEVPRWKAGHPCYSCHNNGDGARALIVASHRNISSGTALDDTVAWLKAPELWERKEQGPTTFLRLSGIQFASALSALVDAGQADQVTLERAAVIVASHQEEDGSWPIDPVGRTVSADHPDTPPNLGSPAGYRTTLATAYAHIVLARANTDSVKPALARADVWLRNFKVETEIDASAVLLGLDRSVDSEAIAQRRRCLDMLKRGQQPDGGWGPQTTLGSEDFSTALTVIALSKLRDTPRLAVPAYKKAQLRDAIERGRQYLLKTQLDDGSWQEKIRDGDTKKASYARRISTTAWTLRALLESTP